MIHKIATRQGFGDVLAERAIRAAQRSELTTGYPPIPVAHSQFTCRIEHFRRTLREEKISLGGYSDPKKADV